MTRLGMVAIATGIAAAAGFTGYFFYERSTEQPDYAVRDSDGQFPLRDYPPLLVAEVVHEGARRQALNAGFRDLAGYTFAKSRGGEKISMTAPVIQDREKIPMTAPVVQDSAAGGSWRTRFVMPARYSRKTLPTPPPGVTIEEVPGRRLAAVRFAGVADDGDLAGKEAELRQWIEAQGLKAVGPAEFAFYNSPMIPGPLRRNEVLIPVSAN